MKPIYVVCIDNVLTRSVPPLAAEQEGTKIYREIPDGNPGVTVELHVAPGKSFTRILNNSGKSIRVSRADAGFVTSGQKALLHYFASNSLGEFDPLKMLLGETQSIQVVAGRSGKGNAPWVGLQCAEGYFSVNVGWSGNWQASTLRQGEDLQLVMGIYEGDFYTDIAPGQSFDGAPVYITYAATSMEDACFAARKYFQENISLINPEEWDRLQISYNTWWCFEDQLVNEQKCLANAKIAGEAGIPNFLLDAGWFGDSGGWYEKRGDWGTVNPDKFPSGLASLSDKMKENNVDFGLWCEIEAIGKDARLNEEHPEFIARRFGRSLGYVCFGNPKVVDWAVDTLDYLVAEYKIHWLKMDFNLDPYQGCNCTEHGHGAGDGLYAHYMGLYSFLERVHEKHPDLLLEECCSGGLRLDYGILSRMHVGFLSDPDYVEHHFQCFWGTTSFIHPSVCYHFTQSQTIGDINGEPGSPIRADMTPEHFDFYILSGMICNVGFSYDFPTWAPWCVQRLKTHIEWFKNISKKYILCGDMRRLTGQALRGGKGDRWQAYQYTAKDGSSLVFVFRLSGAGQSRSVLGMEINDMPEESARVYRIEKDGTTTIER